MRYIAISSKERVFSIHAQHYHDAIHHVWSLFESADLKRVVYVHVEECHIEFRWLNPEEDESYDENFAVYVFDPRKLPEPASLDDFRG